MRADKHGTTWLFEGGRSLAEFFARQIQDKTGSDKTRRHVLGPWRAKKSRVITTTYQSRSMRTPMTPSRSGSRTWISRQAYCCRSNKNRLSNLGSNFTDYNKKLGLKDEASLTQAHKCLDLKYLRQLNRMAALLLHDAVFEPYMRCVTHGTMKSPLAKASTCVV